MVNFMDTILIITDMLNSDANIAHDMQKLQYAPPTFTTLDANNNIAGGILRLQETNGHDTGFTS